MKAHELVMAWVTEELRSGRLSIGDHLPSERALSEQLEVSRSSLREALRVLEALGTIRSATGSGPRSGTVIAAAPEQALSLALKLQLATSQVAPHHLLEMRLLLETWAAQHAETTVDSWSAAERLLTLMDDPTLAVHDFLSLDAAFHTELARASENPLVGMLMDAMRITIADHTLDRARALPLWAETAARLRAEHRAILSAVQNGEGARAAKLLGAHIRGYYLETAGAEESSVIRD